MRRSVCRLGVVEVEKGLAVGLVWCIVCNVVMNPAPAHQHFENDRDAAAHMQFDMWFAPPPENYGHEPHGLESGFDTTPLLATAFMAASTSAPSTWSDTLRINGTTAYLSNGPFRPFGS